MTPNDLSRAVWRTSSHSGQNGNCIEVVTAPCAVAVRDSKNPDGPKLILSPGQWHRLTAQVRTGTFDAVLRSRCPADND